jgi:predicted P-loop ATPase
MNAHTRPDGFDATDIDSRKINITFFQNEYASSLRAEAMTLPALRDLILATRGVTKGSLPWLKGARFGNKHEAKADGTISTCLRWDGNVLGFDLLELDYDKEVMSFDEAVATVRAMGVRALVYSTPSHTNVAPRWRILLPISRGDYELRMRAEFCARVNGRFGKIFATESFTLSQSYYFGLALDNPAPDHRCEVIDGRLVDLCDEFLKYQKDGGPEKPEQPKTGGGHRKGGRGKFYDEDFNFEAHLKSMGDGGDLKGFHKPLTSATASYAFHHGTDFDREALKAKLREAINAAPKKANRKVSDITDYLSDRYLNDIIASAIGKYGTAKQNVRDWGDIGWRERRVTGKPVASMHNARLAIAALGVACSRDTFHNKTLFGYRDEKFKHELQSIVGEVSDDGIIALRQMMSDRFGFDLEDKATRDAVKSLALENCFNPVCDLIDKAECEWDGVKRLDRMAADYFNCEDTQLNSAFIRKTMIALVARARVPGIKFDTITVLESPEGFNKSTAWRILAGDENYSDERIIGSNAREVQEQLSEIWIHENADLAGLKKAEVETVKAYASRTVDIARPAFGHFLRKQPRHSIEVGTTNSNEYLQSQTGNRRFWPLKVLKTIDIEKLRRDRLQLIGEAAKYQSSGESVVLDGSLWSAARVQQEDRRVKDPWESVLAKIPARIEVESYRDGFKRTQDIQIVHFHDGQERVASAHLMKYLLDIPIAQQTTANLMRLSTVMKQAGWERASNGRVRITGERVMGYFRAPHAEEGPDEDL